MPPSPAASATPSTPSGAPSKSSPVSPHDSPTAATQPRPVASPRRPDPALISIDTLRTRGFVTPDAAPTALSQEFRVIKRPLLDNAFGRGVAPVANGRRVMVTSAYSGEGKSFCEINLAMIIAAERDTYVLLVDADVAKPSIPTELGFSTTRGLMDCLNDPHLDVGEVVLPTNIERLSVLPAGRRHEQATELLASSAMGALVDHLASRYDDRIIIFDSPPILMTTESRVLASYMGQIVMVVEAGNTPRDAVADAITAMGSPEMVGMVLNKSREARHGGYQGYGYGYAAA
ncbi:MAG: XrtA-associated tyrosine autokinase [Burkholderiales bacterium]